VAGRLSSYRFRRRLLWTGLTLTALGTCALVAVLFWNTGPLQEETFSGGVAQTYVKPKAVRLDASERAKIVAIAKRFVASAVTRDDPGSAFELAGPSMRTGTTRASWESGNIPVVPFPVDEARWRVDYSYENEVGLEVYAWPEPNQGFRPTIFFMSLVAVEQAEGRRWLVDSWIPRGGSPEVILQRITGRSPLSPVSMERASSRASAAWLLVLPAVLLVALIALPLGLILKTRLSARRMARS
jgi:hypothetical protein